MSYYTDAQIDAYYSRNYYGEGTDYFDPPYCEDDLDEVIGEDEDGI